MCKSPALAAARDCAAGLVCPNSKLFTFDELQLSDDMVMIHAPRVRRFVCSKCGSRKVQVRSAGAETYRAVLQPLNGLIIDPALFRCAGTLGFAAFITLFDVLDFELL